PPTQSAARADEPTAPAREWNRTRPRLKRHHEDDDLEREEAASDPWNAASSKSLRPPTGHPLAYHVPEMVHAAKDNAGSALGSEARPTLNSDALARKRLRLDLRLGLERGSVDRAAQPADHERGARLSGAFVNHHQAEETIELVHQLHV